MQTVSRGTLAAALMLAAALAAVLVANTGLYEPLHTCLSIPFTLGVSTIFALELTPELVVNDLLMTLFFLQVGIELKQEMTEGELNHPRRALLPMLAALGGACCPALIYALVNWGGQVQGWAIPMATDIAFALGVLALLGERIPHGVSVFFSTLAVADDLLAIVAIALFYGHTPQAFWLGAMAVIVAVLLVLNRRGVTNFVCYLALGALLWVCTFMSGVHATLAGVLLAFCMPSQLNEQLRSKIETFVNFVVLPIFAFVNAQVRLVDADLGAILASPVALGTYAGMVLGKPLGIFGTSLLLAHTKLCELPRHVTWGHMWGVGLLGGIGFTMSILIAQLAFGVQPQEMLAAKTAILAGSLTAAALGCAYMAIISRTSSASRSACVEEAPTSEHAHQFEKKQ